MQRFNVIDQLGYLAFEVSDLKAWATFATDILGLEVVHQQSGGFALRMDGHAQRLILREGPANDLVAVGWQSSSLDEVCLGLEKAGVGVGMASSDELQNRRVERMIKFQDPGDIAIEVFSGPEMAEKPFSSSVVPSGFLADELGLGHLVISTNDRERSKDFYCDVLGFRLSDRIQCELPGGYEVDIAFLRTNERHHSLALGSAMPKRIHHFLIEANEMDEVGLACDRAKRARVHVQNSLGRHPNDQMFSFYADTPSDFQFEFGWGGRRVDESKWTPTTYDHISSWGHQFRMKRKPDDTRAIKVTEKHDE